jgi:hypothetical protein
MVFSILLTRTHGRRNASRGLDLDKGYDVIVQIIPSLEKYVARMVVYAELHSGAHVLAGLLIDCISSAL